MITDKDMEEAKNITLLIARYLVEGDGNPDNDIPEYVSRIRFESADQARKEAADRFCASCHGKEDGMCGECPDRAVILGETVKEGKTDAEKLAIAVKALKCICEMRWGDSWKVADRALKEIQ